MKISTIVLAALSLLLTFRSARALELVKDGKAVATIVVDGPALELDQKTKKRPAKQVRNFAADDVHAAEVLADWIEKITGAKLSVSRAAPKEGAAIFVGTAAVKAGLKLDAIDSPSHEGVRIVAGDTRILIGGQNGTATVKAVCRFLEELGCRCFMDNPLGEVYPKTQTLSVGMLDISEAPGFLHRNAKGPSWRGYDQALWTVWNGQGGIDLSHSHSWGGYVPASEFAAHPDFFAMNADGNRVASGWLCTSNPELRDFFAERVAAKIRGGAHNPSISPTDGRGYCQCPACKAQDNPNETEPSSGTVSMSRRYVDFFNAIGNKVAATNPDSILSFYCYADYTQPPQGMKCAPNLCAFIAPIRYCRLHGMDNPLCPSRQQARAMIEGWAGEAQKIGYYEYDYDLAEATVPFSRISVLKHDIPYLKSKGCIGLTMEMLSNWHIYGPQMYLALRLAYAPNANTDAIMDDYFSKFFGPKAGPFMKEYWMGIDQAQSKLDCHSGGFHWVNLLYTPEFLEKCRQLLKQAADAAAGDAQYAARVAVHAEGLKSAEEYMQLWNAMNAGDFAGAKDTYTKITARLEHLATQRYANREYASKYLERFVKAAVDAGAAATAKPNKLLSVLGDEWRFAWDEKNAGIEAGFAKTDFDDTGWKRVATFSKTLNAQGLPDKLTVMWYRTTIDIPAQHPKLSLLFTQVDGLAEVYVNGVQAPIVGAAKRNAPFEVDITASAHAGKNCVAVRVDHSRLTDLFLGGILRPVLLIEKP
ncbi:MAG TPA: DUF4838 domain-containing protein [Planctomycetota bacterium]|nr:DUF4838 domain-containing protein [Planctomycetota bacterium]